MMLDKDLLKLCEKDIEDAKLHEAIDALTDDQTQLQAKIDEYTDNIRKASRTILTCTAKIQELQHMATRVANALAMTPEMKIKFTGEQVTGTKELIDQDLISAITVAYLNDSSIKLTDKQLKMVNLQLLAKRLAKELKGYKTEKAPFTERSANALARNGVYDLYAVSHITHQSLFYLEGVGVKSSEDIRNLMAMVGHPCPPANLLPVLDRTIITRGDKETSDFMRKYDLYTLRDFAESNEAIIRTAPYRVKDLWLKAIKTRDKEDRLREHA